MAEASPPAAAPLAAAPPVVRFLRMIDGARAPQRADRAAGGTLPTRAYRYCEAVTTASGFGWYVFPAIALRLLWDGESISWTYDGAPQWYPLHAAQYPHFKSRFDAVAPAALKGYSPPFIAAFPEPGLLNIWSGWFARTIPGWSLLLRPPANLPRRPGYEVYEGMLEADRWFGPLFINLRLTRTGVPIDLPTDYPLFQVQAIPRPAYQEEVLNRFDVTERLEDFTAADWDAYHHSIVQPREHGPIPPGREAGIVRRRRKARTESAQ